MRYVAAYLLAALGGKENPSAADIEKIFSSVGIEVDKEKLTKVISELKGKNLEEIIAQGQEKLSSMPAGGGGGAVAAPAGAAPAAAEKKEEKKEEKKAESEESDDDMGFGLFD
ncbi:large ribosomal subunit protein P2-like [Cloeon dipterum]|uniref:large ribosomal subunit protein P2-like n=1 Tax=Cloeon dipterum TaxID=197152 RepID=UPI0032204BE3